jgi:hypothetical protein
MPKKPIEIAKEIIERSGNTFHSKVLKYLQEKGWTVLISPYYSDNVSNKPREIDLIAEKAFPVKSGFGEWQGTVNVKLFIECKYINQITVFWLHDKDEQQAESLIVRTSPLTEDSAKKAEHHYLAGSDKVAKLFADERKKSVENEIFYKALNQSLNAMVYYRNEESIVKEQPPYITNILATVHYPIIVCNSFDSLYKVEIDDDADPVNIEDNFQLEVNYAYVSSNGNSKNEYFLIDVINFDKVDELLKTIESDARIFGYYLNKY